MRTYLPLILLAGLVACGDDDAPVADGSIGPVIDADPAAPDAAPGQPDAAPVDCDPVTGIPTLTTEVVAGGFDAPVVAVVPPGETRLFVADKAGFIYIIENGEKREPAFLNIDALTSGGPQSERGFLGMAFHPGYATNKRFYVYYTSTTNGDIKLAEYTATDANTANVASGLVILTVGHSQFGNHNGGWLAFGPDGKLYMATGDGGDGGDPDGNGQNKNVLLGKILRLDVDTAGSYDIPSNNPFVGMKNHKEEIWAYGVRNPWRNSFDRQTGDLYIADVGQDAFEEINVQPANSTGGLNYGWDIMEASDCYNAGSCDMNGKVLPVHEYSHIPFNPDAASVTGGYVYRGCKMPDLRGTYFFGDVVNGFVKSFKWDGAGGITDLKENYTQFDSIVPYAFGEDAEGELLILDFVSGNVLRLIPAAP